jgi:hypothetical protein
MQKVIRLLKEFFKDPTVLPPPDYSVKRPAQVLLDQQKYLFKMLRLS